MKSTKNNHDLLTIQMMSDKTGLSKKSLHCAIKRLAIPRKRTPGINGYTFTNEEFKLICSDDYIFEKMHNYRLRDYDRPPVVITYHFYQSKMNVM
jgi:hypothetical protein